MLELFPGYTAGDIWILSLRHPPDRSGLSSLPSFWLPPPISPTDTATSLTMSQQ